MFSRCIRVPYFLSIACAAIFCAVPIGGLAQTPPSAPPEDEVVVIIDGEEYTREDLEHLRESLPGSFKKRVQKMNNRTFIQVYGELLGFAKQAEALGIPEKEPYRTQLEFNRMNYLAQVYLDRINKSITATEEDIAAYYQEHLPNYEKRRVSAIYIDYALDPNRAPEKDGKRPLSEEEAALKAARLTKQLREGADFAVLAKEHSDDSASAEKGGDLGYFEYTARLPQPLKETIFKLEEGEFSLPQKHGGRFYIFKVTDREVQPLEEVREQIEPRVRAAKLKEKIDEIRASVDIDYRDEAYLNSKPSSGGPQGFTKELRISPPRKKK